MSLNSVYFVFLPAQDATAAPPHLCFFYYCMPEACKTHQCCFRFSHLSFSLAYMAGLGAWCFIPKYDVAVCGRCYFDY